MADNSGTSIGVLGTGIIGEATSLFIARHNEQIGIATSWCLKNSRPKAEEIPKLQKLAAAGVTLVTWDHLLPEFADMGLTETSSFSSVAGQTRVIIDCSPDANENHSKYEPYPDLNVIAHGGSGQFGDGIFVEGVNRSVLTPSSRRMMIGSCNTNGGSTIAFAIRTLTQDPNLFGHLTVMRRASDLGQQNQIASVEPQSHSHHAADIMKVLQSNDSFPITSVAVTVPEQKLHTNVAFFDTTTKVTPADVQNQLSQTRVALTRLKNAGEVFYSGLTHGFAGRLLVPAVVPVQNIEVVEMRGFYRIILVYYVPQMGNVVLPSLTAALWMIHRDRKAVDEILDRVCRPYLPDWV